MYPSTVGDYLLSQAATWEINGRFIIWGLLKTAQTELEFESTIICSGPKYY